MGAYLSMSLVIHSRESDCGKGFDIKMGKSHLAVVYGPTIVGWIDDVSDKALLEGFPSCKDQTGA